MFEASSVKLPIWFARLIAAIIFIALVASAIHFLATKPSSGALTKATRLEVAMRRSASATDPNNSLYFSGTLDDVRFYKRAPVMRPLTAM